MKEHNGLQFTPDKLAHFSKEQLIQLFIVESNRIIKENISIKNENTELKKLKKELEDKIIEIEGQLVVLRNKLFRKSSEKNKSKQDSTPRNPRAKNKGDQKKLLPSERYPEAEIIERHIEFKDKPNCHCCGHTMQDSGMTEDCEYLTVRPKEYYIILQRRHKYRCLKCHGSIQTAPSPKRIIPGSSYGDEMILDVAMAKYCDLVPIERYSAIAGREGLIDIPPNSLIATTHKLAEYVQPAVDKIKEEILSSAVLHADETPHRMLEGDEKKHWYLWGFSNQESSYFEIRNTRSGDVASEILNHAQCQFLVSDVFSGYERAVRESNKIRDSKQQNLILNVYCNAHSRRKFKEALEHFPEEAQYFMEGYHTIYLLEKEGQTNTGQLAGNREKMRAIFSDMYSKAEQIKDHFSAKSTIVTAINYFLKHYSGLTLFLINPNLPIDNNHQERQLRNPVIGRKTWFGSHSKQGAKTSAIFFTLVESCKLNKINPRHYFKALVDQLHTGKPAFTPKEFKRLSIDTG